MEEIAISVLFISFLSTLALCELLVRGHEALPSKIQSRRSRRGNARIDEGSRMLRPADLDGWCAMFFVRHSDYDGCGSALDSHQTSPERGTIQLSPKSSKASSLQP